MQYPYTMPLPVLANWSAFLVQIFRPRKVMTETIWATCRAQNGRYRPEIDPNIIEMSLRLAFQACLCLYLMLLGLMAKVFSWLFFPPPTSPHLPPHLTSPPIPPMSSLHWSEISAHLKNYFKIFGCSIRVYQSLQQCEGTSMN